MRLAILFLFLAAFAWPLCAQSSSGITTAEAQTLADAYNQTLQHGVSYLNLAYAQLAAGLTALFLLLNLRSLAFVSLIGYGVAILNVPYYIPTVFKYFFGIAIIIISLVGLLSRLLALRKPTPKA